MAGGAFVGLLAAAGLGAAYATFVEPRWYRVRHSTLPGSLEPAGRRDLRVLLLADTHHQPPRGGDEPDGPLAAFVRELVALEPDIVVAAGDLLGAVGAETATVNLLAPLLSRGAAGIVVFGSNDVFAPTPKSPHHYFVSDRPLLVGRRHDVDAFRKGLESTGWLVMENERALLSTGAGPVEVAGLRDPHVPAWRTPPSEQVAGRDPDAIARIGVVHAPYRAALDALVEGGYRVLLSGHTHGGQVRVPGVGALVTNSDLPTSMARGTSRWGEAWLHVTAGLGQSRYAPFRFACRPEASLLTLTP